MTSLLQDGHERWARMRFSVVGPLLAAPPPRGELAAELTRLAAKTWRHPTSGEPTHFAFSTIERWYYAALGELQDPVAALRRRPRKDRGRRRALADRLAAALIAQHVAHPGWSYKLHADNLAALAAADATLGRPPSYSVVRRFMKEHGLERLRRRRGRRAEPRDGAAPSAARADFAPRETRSYEAEHVHGLWHLDFHHGSRKVLTRQGEWITPIALCVLDDRSRLVCHVQWYRAETAESLVHGLAQAIQKRGLPRALLTDNGAAMLAGETVEGLARLGVVHETTLPYSPHQNGKQEVFWAQLEGRLVAMLEGVVELGLDELNHTTQAWVELEYNRKVHGETGETPADRCLAGPSVGRTSPDAEALRLAFRVDETRTQRRSDGTVSVEGVRLEVPARYRHLERVRVRYASWDKGRVHLVCPTTGALLTPLYPLDRARNASGRRRALEAPASAPVPPAPSGMAPLLADLVARYDAARLPPAYLPERVTTTAAVDHDACKENA
jgi:transposase InsO family protein